MKDMQPEYVGLEVCDLCGSGSESTPVKVWRMFVHRAGSADAEINLCKACLVRHGHEAPVPRTAEDVIRDADESAIAAGVAELIRQPPAPTPALAAALKRNP